ncbi:hypothetical protein KJ785_04475 [Patescibacteria group bacterium]|nr:hypothetical protein [Patescibacteria group bacterium]
MGTPKPSRPEHWGHAHYGEILLPKQFYKGKEGKEGAEVRIMAGEFVNIRRSSGDIQEAYIDHFDSQTGDASVSFNHESGNLANKMVHRKELEELNPNGSRKEPQK